jgi:hypothetical protein
MTTTKPPVAPEAPPRPERQPKHDQPHSGVDRRRRDMRGRRYSGTTWSKR